MCAWLPRQRILHLYALTLCVWLELCLATSLLPTYLSQVDLSSSLNIRSRLAAVQPTSSQKLITDPAEVMMPNGGGMRVVVVMVVVLVVVMVVVLVVVMVVVA